MIFYYKFFKFRGACPEVIIKYCYDLSKMYYLQTGKTTFEYFINWFLIAKVDRKLMKM